MIGELRGVAFARSVYQCAVVERKNYGVVPVGIAFVHVWQRAGGHPRALILDNLGIFGNILARKKSASVDFAFFDEPVFAFGGYRHKVMGSFTLTGSRM